MILNEDVFKETITYHEEFDIDDAVTLLKYHMYLQYNIVIQLKSINSYEAINYFLNSINTRISSKFFKNITAFVGMNTIGIYNEFIRSFKILMSDTDVIKTRLANGYLTSYQSSKIENLELFLEHFDVVS